MSAHAHVAPVDYAALDDNALVALVRGGQREAFSHIMQRCNQRLFRVARAVLGEDRKRKTCCRNRICAPTTNSIRSAATRPC